MLDYANLTKEEQIKLAEAIHEMDRRKKSDPLRFSERHFKQTQFYKAPQSIRALFWGNRCGKTEVGAMEVARYLLGRHEYRKIDTPVEVWAICPSFDAQAETTQKKLLTYIPEDRIVDSTTIRKGIYSFLAIKADDGSISTVHFKSYEQGREKFQGAGKRLIWFDEEPPRDIWDECLVRQEAGQPLDIILTMTPIKGLTWVYDTIYLSSDTDLYYVSTAGWDDNPWLTEEQKDIMSRGLTKDALAVRREGKFTKRVGLVCSWWDRDIHLRHYSEYPTEWSYYEVLDGGYSDPAAWLLIGVDHDDNIHIIDGYREPQLMADGIKSLRDTKIAGMLIRHGWSDNDNPRLNKELRLYGMNLEPVVKRPGDKLGWDEALAEKLSQYGTVQKGTGQPRLYISDSLKRTDERTGINQNWLVQEIENLMWLEQTTDGIVEQKPKWDDHRKYGHHFDGIRALSYFLMAYKTEKEPAKAVINKVSDDPYSRAYTPYTDFERGVL